MKDMNDVFCLKKDLMEMLLTTMESRAAVFNFSSDNIYVSDKLYDLFGAENLDPDDPASRQRFIDNLKENSVKTASQSEICSHRSGIVDSDEKYLIFHLFHTKGTYFGYFVDMTEEVFGKLKMRKELSETRKKSQTDALTGVLNRNGFETTVKDFMKTHSDACVLCIMDMEGQ